MIPKGTVFGEAAGGLLVKDELDGAGG